MANFPQLADPVQLPLAELPRTATMKVQRIELSRRLRQRFEAAHPQVPTAVAYHPGACFAWLQAWHRPWPLSTVVAPPAAWGVTWSAWRIGA